MSKRPPASLRVGIVLSPRDIAAIDDAATREDMTRSAWTRRLIRNRLRELAAAQEGAAA